WEHDDGFTVLMDSRVVKKTKVKFWIPGRTGVLNYVERVPTKKINGRSQKTEISPSYIQSFDARYLREVVRLCAAGSTDAAPITSFAISHDCFGVPANSAATLDDVLKAAVTAVYSRDVLTEQAAKWMVAAGGAPAHEATLAAGWGWGDIRE